MFRAQASVVFLMALGPQAWANSFADHLGPRELAVGESMRGEAVGSSSITLNPAGVALNRQLVFDVSYGFRNSDDASIVAASACDSTTPVAGCFYYHFLTSEPSGADGSYERSFHEGGFTAARALTQQLYLGANTRFFDYNADAVGDEDARGFAVDLGLIVAATSSVHLAAVGYNLVGTKSSQYQRGLGSGLTFRPKDGALGVNLDGLWNLDGGKGGRKGRYGGGVEYFLRGGSAGYPLRGGGVYDAVAETGHLTFGLGYHSSTVGFDIGGRRQISGSGKEFVVQLGLRFLGSTQ